MKTSENSLKNISRPWILADNWHLHVCQKVISWAFYLLLLMLSFQKKKENYDKKEFLISVKIFYPTKKLRPFKNYYFIIWFHGIYCKCNVCSFTMYCINKDHAVYWWNDHYPKSNFWVSSMYQPQNFVEGKLNKVFPKKKLVPI